MVFAKTIERIFGSSKQNNPAPTASQPVSVNSSSQADTVLLLDDSVSMQELMPDGIRKIEAIKQAAVILAEQRQLLDPQNQVAVVKYGFKAKVCVPWSNSKQLSDQVKTGVRHLKADGYTNIGAGLKKSGELLNACHGNRMIFLLTDGIFNRGPNPADVALKLKEAGIYIAVRGFGPDPSCINEELMREVASQRSSGEPDYDFWHAESMGHLLEAAEEMGSLRMFNPNL